jgi:hypothetical protein
MVNIEKDDGYIRISNSKRTYGDNEVAVLFEGKRIGCCVIEGDRYVVNISKHSFKLMASYLKDTKQKNINDPIKRKLITRAYIMLTNYKPYYVELNSECNQR